ncbi:MAG: hypothetical protein HZB16_10005 [Armatimonadetes bacterium]|nr:hypothetical protein [Armatimonadota bacterium]
MNLLVIAYGNPSRMDDGAGHYILNRLNEAWGLPLVDLLGEPGEDTVAVDGHRVRTMWVQQLDMGLAEDCAQVDRVLFLDAHVDDVGLVIAPVTDPSGLGLTSHVLTAATVLALAGSAYGHRPEGFRCTVRGERFDFADELTPDTLRRCQTMTERLLAGALAPEGPSLEPAGDA